MRILQITNGFPPTATAGVEQYTHQLSRGLSAHHDVRIFCRESAPERADYTIIDEELDGLRVRRVVNDFQHAAQIQDFYLDRRIESIFQQTLREWQPDLLHFQHCIGLSASLLEAAAGAEVPYLLTLHDYWFICSRVQLLHRQGHICPGSIADVDCYDCTFSPDDIFRRLKGTWLYRLLRSRLNDYTKRRILGALARATPNLPLARRGPTLSPYKERDRYMLSVLANTPRLLTPSRFVRDLYIKHGVPESRVQVLPLGLDLSPWRVARPEAANAANGLRVGYLGSLLRHKGVDLLVRAFRQLETPGSTLQLLSGTPVVASETGALPEIINSGQNGLLVPVGDAGALHDALHRLSVDPDLLARMKHGARLSAKKIKSMDEHVHEVDLLYKTLASQHQRSVTASTTSPVTASPKPGRADHLEAHP
jgi:glycosyltransferase involved in cell wall biosynthesis